MNRVLQAATPANVIWLDDCDSTNAVAARLVESWLAAEEDPLPETLLVAQRQSAGRGRGSHGWKSPVGGLYATWLAWLPLRMLPTLPMAVAVSLGAAVEELVPGVRVELKWPNDLLVGGHKLGGVLSAGRSDGEASWVSVGFGINIGPVPVLAPGDRTRPVSLTSLGFRGNATEGIWSLVAGFLGRVHPALEDPEGSRAEWVARSVHRAGETMHLRVPSGAVEGRFVGFGEEGELEIEVGGKVARFSTGELLTEKDPGAEMLLALDVGNTHTTIGVFRAGEILRRWRLSTVRERTVDEIGILLRQLCEWAEIRVDDIKGVVVGSVVPPLDASLRAAVSSYLHAQPLFVAPGIKSGMPLKVETPLELGADRLCNSVAAFAEYGGPCVVVDFGTASTWDVVSEKGEFLGGVIAPGLEIAAEALFSRAAKLPRIELAAPPRVIGKGTVDSMQAGLVYGYVGLVEGLTGRVLAELGGGTVVATGGLAPVIARYTKIFDVVDDDLTLKGLRLLWERNRPEHG